LEYLDSICLDQPEIFCTCDNSNPGDSSSNPDTTAKPTTTRNEAVDKIPFPTPCDRRPIILYLLWIEDDFGLRNHKNSHKMGEFLGYFLNQMSKYLPDHTLEGMVTYHFEFHSRMK
jgi:hypothetical protein